MGQLPGLHRRYYERLMEDRWGGEKNEDGKQIKSHRRGIYKGSHRVKIWTEIVDRPFAFIAII